MSEKDFVVAILALLAVIATAFISIRGDVRDLTIKVSALEAQLDSVHEVCCGEIP
jgi:Tfp pilus assembly protein FimT